MRTLKNFRKKSHKAEKREESHSAEKVRAFCFGILVKKLANTHGFEQEPSGLKNKHLTTRQGAAFNGWLLLVVVVFTTTKSG